MTMTSQSDPRMLVIVPAYNEEKTIARVVRGIRERIGNQGDVLVISDGSSDDTSLRAEEAGATVVEFAVNLGYGSALRAGYRYALRGGYDLVVQMDGDGQHDPSAIFGLVRPIQEGRASVVIGSRYLGETSYRVPMMRWMGQAVFGLLLRLLTGKRVTDPTSGYQAIHRRVLPLYVSEEFPTDYPDVDVLLLLHRKGFEFCEVGAVFHKAETGRSMHSGLRPLYYVLKMVLSMLLVIYRHRGHRSEAGPGSVGLEPGLSGPTPTAEHQILSRHQET